MSCKYETWEYVPESPLKDQLRAIVSQSPTSLALDCLLREPDDLQIVLKTLRVVEVYTVTTLSMRYCPALRTEAGLDLLLELCGEVWENPQPKGVLTFGPNLAMIETMYLRYYF